VVKNPPANEGGPGDAGFISSLGPKDPLEKEMPTHSSILAGKFHRQRSLAVTKSRKQVSTHRPSLFLSNNKAISPILKSPLNPLYYLKIFNIRPEHFLYNPRQSPSLCFL